MPSKVKQIKNWADEKSDEYQAYVFSCCDLGSEATSEQIIGKVAKIKFIEDLNEFIEALGDDE